MGNMNCVLAFDKYRQITIKKLCFFAYMFLLFTVYNISICTVYLTITSSIKSFLIFWLENITLLLKLPISVERISLCLQHMLLNLFSFRYFHFRVHNICSSTILQKKNLLEQKIYYWIEYIFSKSFNLHKYIHFWLAESIKEK